MEAGLVGLASSRSVLGLSLPVVRSGLVDPEPEEAAEREEEEEEEG